MRGRFGFVTTLVLFIVAMLVEGSSSFDRHIEYTNVWQALEAALFNSLIAFSLMMSIRAFFLFLTGRTRTSSWMAGIATIVFGISAWYPLLLIVSVLAGLGLFYAAWRSESNLKPWSWLKFFDPEEPQQRTERYCPYCSERTKPVRRDYCSVCGRTYVRQ